MEIHFAKKYSTFGNCVIFILLFLFLISLNFSEIALLILNKFIIFIN